MGQSIKADHLPLPDQSQSQKCVAGVTPRYELSRRTRKIQNLDKKVKISQGLSKLQEVSLKETTNSDIVP